jgi:hypothetical protein
MEEDLEYLSNDDYFLQTKRIHPRRMEEIRAANQALQTAEEWRLYSDAECHREEVLVELDAALEEIKKLKAQLQESELSLCIWQSGTYQ